MLNKISNTTKRFSFKSIDKLAEELDKDKESEAEDIIEGADSLEEAEEKLEKL